MRNVVIASAKRTPIGKFHGQYKDLTAADLGAAAARAALEGIQPEAVDEVIFANARQAGNGPNIARQVLHKAGIPISVPAFTVNKACASSLKAITLAYQAIVLGDADVVLAGGTENMTRTPFLLDQMRSGYRLGNAKVVDAMYKDGFLCPLCGQLMGETAENLAEKYSIGREEQDRYAMESQRRCSESDFTSEIAPVALPAKEGTLTISTDEHPRATTMADLAKLSPVFKKTGTVTPGNACGIADAGAAVVVMAEDKAKELGVKPMARVTGYSQVGVDPKYMGIGPVEAVRKLEKRTGTKLDQYDLIELNEAFAVQVLACQRDLKFDMARTNVKGGAIALGHPIGATGARIVVTLLHAMQQRKAKRGLATLCVSGGLGMAVSFEAV
jgi:acetyl-CoA C-acetyltransferase